MPNLLRDVFNTNEIETEIKVNFKDRESYKPRWKSIFRNYILSSVVAGLLPAFCWVPGFLAISGGRLEQTTASEFSFKKPNIYDDFRKR